MTLSAAQRKFRYEFLKAALAYYSPDEITEAVAEAANRVERLNANAASLDLLDKTAANEIVESGASGLLTGLYSKLLQKGYDLGALGLTSAVDVGKGMAPYAAIAALAGPPLAAYYAGDTAAQLADTPGADMADDIKKREEIRTLNEQTKRLEGVRQLRQHLA